MTIQDPKQLPEYDQVVTQNKKQFKVTKGKKTFSYEILGHELITLRPITLLDKTRMILVYLPTKIKDMTDEKNTEVQFENRAFFVINDGNEKKILPADYKELTDKYKITVLESGYSLRWDIDDLTNWINDIVKLDVKKLYNTHDKLIRKYLDFANENDYVYFNLWNMATYLYELFDVFPYNDYTGTKRAGKTKALNFQNLVCFNAIVSGNMTGSSFFRVAEGLGGTILQDETESFKRKKDEQAQTIRTLLLQRFMKDSAAYRSEANATGGFTPTKYNLYGPTSLGHISALDDVLEDRCIQQLMQRSKSKEILGTWPDKRDQTFSQIRNYCYRLFLDYGDEINDLQHEARNLLDISGRELQLWTPIITLALFFERHGIPNLVKQIKEKSTTTADNRQISDEQETKELKVLKFVDEVMVKVVEDHESLAANPEGWVNVGRIYSELKLVAASYEINMEYYTRPKLTEDLKRLGFIQERKPLGYSWLLTREQVDSAKERMGMTKPKQDTLI